MFQEEKMIKKIFVSICLVSFTFFSETSLLYADGEQLKLIISTQDGEGEVIIELFSDIAPKHVERITTLAEAGKYNKIAFHRVIENFMAQTGDVAFGHVESFDENRVGTGGSDFEDLTAEFSSKPFKPGTLGMARSRNPNSANSQFFITTKAAPHLNGKYTIFGQVIEGMEVVNNIKLGDPRANGKVSDPDYIVSATVTSSQ